jgi:FMN phosphatase YigB (HAD superfamily)
LIYVTDGKRHLICWPYSKANLHLMAKELGIKKCWFHKDHYDIPKRRVKEIEAKCVLVSPKDIVTIIKGKLLDA